MFGLLGNADATITRLGADTRGVFDVVGCVVREPVEFSQDRKRWDAVVAGGWSVVCGGAPDVVRSRGGRGQGVNVPQGNLGREAQVLPLDTGREELPRLWERSNGEVWFVLCGPASCSTLSN